MYEYEQQMAFPYVIYRMTCTFPGPVSNGFLPLGMLERMHIQESPTCNTGAEAFYSKRNYNHKSKGKGRLWVLQHCCLEAYCALTQMSSFIHLQRRCTHQAAWETSASEGRNYTWNLASNP